MDEYRAELSGDQEARIGWCPCSVPHTRHSNRSVMFAEGGCEDQELAGEVCHAEPREDDYAKAAAGPPTLRLLFSMEQ